MLLKDEKKNIQITQMEAYIYGNLNFSMIKIVSCTIKNIKRLNYNKTRNNPLISKESRI